MAKQPISVMILTSSAEHTGEIESLLAGELIGCVFLRPPTLKEASEQLQKIQPNLLILECDLPDGKASDLLRAFPPNKRSCAVLVISRDRSESVFQEMFDLGAEDFMFEPLDILVLQSKVRSLLSQHYMSPLSFLGRREGLADFTIQNPVQVLTLDEEQLTMLSPFPIAKGTIFRIQVADFNLQAVIHNTERSEKAEFLVRALLDPVSEEDGRRLRQFLLKTANNGVNSTQTL